MWLDCHRHGAARPFAESRALFSLDYSQKAALADPNAAFSIGFHPWYLPEKAVFEQYLAELSELASLPQVWAIGEAGLDKYYERLHGPEWQKYALSAQISLAQSLQKPIILHTVGRYNETLQLLKPMAGKIPIILHGFGQRIEVAAMFERLGAYLSFGVDILHKPNAQASLRGYSSDRILLETDAQAQYDIKQIYEAGAALRAQEISEFATQIAQNFGDVFGAARNCALGG